MSRGPDSVEVCYSARCPCTGDTCASHNCIRCSGAVRRNSISRRRPCCHNTPFLMGTHGDAAAAPAAAAANVDEESEEPLTVTGSPD